VNVTAYERQMTKWLKSDVWQRWQKASLNTVDLAYEELSKLESRLPAEYI